jgi:type II secretory pathway component PulM
MTLGILLAVVIAVTALGYVLAPLLNRNALESDERSEASLDELRTLHARQQMLLASLKDLEDDRQTDKIGAEDFERLNSRLSQQTIEVMQRIDVVEKEREQILEREREAGRPLAYPGKRRSDGSP